jgi:diaminohydroxyphosphoribosylaminopyrimidine deaminase/5-amino-6-(5-phosphoribosylamino)uracil reductase
MFNSEDRKHMKKALALARKNIGLAGPNPSVGCVVVRDGNIVGHGWHEYERMDHAEVGALKMAGEKGRGATVYVTLEPCCHQGRTPACTNLLVRRKVRRVVVARIDPNPKISGGGIARLRSAGIQVDVGLLEGPAGEIIEPFACSITTGMPLVVSKVGMSLDGKIGTGEKEGRWITSPKGRAYGQSLRLRSDAILVGVGTVLSDNPELTYRGKMPRRKPLQRIILDSNLRTPADAEIFRSVDRNPVIIFCSKGNLHSRCTELERRGAEIVEIQSVEGCPDLEAVLEELARRDVQGLLVEGGSRVHWEFISKKLVDRFDFIIAPIVLGGEKSVPSIGGRGFGATADAPRFRIRRKFSVGQDMVFQGYPSYSRSLLSPWLSIK